MKKLFILLFSLLFIFSCSKDEEINPKDEIIGIWEGKIFINNDDNFDKIESSMLLQEGIKPVELLIEEYHATLFDESNDVMGPKSYYYYVDTTFICQFSNTILMTLYFNGTVFHGDVYYNNLGKEYKVLFNKKK